MRRLISLFAAALLTTGLLTGPAAAAPPPTCVAPVPSPTQPGYTIADPNCDVGTNNPFVPLVDAAGQPLSRVFTGIRDGAAFRIEVPLRWNGELVIWAHGFRGTGRTVWVDSSPLRAFHVQQGLHDGRLDGRTHHRGGHRALPAYLRRRHAAVRRAGRRQAVRLLPRRQRHRGRADRRADHVPAPAATRLPADLDPAGTRGAAVAGHRLRHRHAADAHAAGPAMGRRGRAA